uniref:Pentatricopeptide repeat-containing protein At1g80550, mitochondrial n=1 Tax=Anthurium amnicola TaxID=1678845 RepID=A0A1D1XHX4_9ARAE
MPFPISSLPHRCSPHLPRSPSRLLPLHFLLHFSSPSRGTSPPPNPGRRTKPRRIPSRNSTNATADHRGPFDPQTVLEALSCYANDWARALEFFHWVEEAHGFRHTLDTYNRAIDVLGKFFEFGRAWGLVRRMRSHPSHPPVQPAHSTFRVLFKRYAAAHLVQEAVDAFDRSAEFGLRDHTGFHHLVDALCEYKHVIEVEDLYLRKDPPPFPLDTKIYNMVLRGWYKMGWWKKCREFWEVMDEKGVRKDLHSYSIYMDILSKSGKPWRAVKLYKEMKRVNISLDVVAYNTVVQAIGLSNGVDDSIRLYREMLDLGCPPNVVTYNTIIKLLCRSGRVRDAYAFLDQMRKKDCEPNVLTYHCFFQYLDRPKEILELFEWMVGNGCRPRMDTYVMLMRKFGRWGFLRPVFIIWRAMEEHGCTPDGFAYNSLIDALIQKGMIELARKYDEEMLAKGLSAKPRKELQTNGSGKESDDSISDVF